MSFGEVNVDLIGEEVKKRWHSIKAEGEMIFVCPPWSDKLHRNFHEFEVHYKLGKGSIACLKQFGQVCPVCMANNELFGHKDDKVAQEISKDIYARRVYLYNIIPNVRQEGVNVLSTVPEPKVEILAAGVNLHNMLIGLFSKIGNYTHPQRATLLHLSKQVGPQQDPKFGRPMAYPLGTAATLAPNLVKLLETGLYDLSQEIKPRSMDELKNLVDMKLAMWRSSRGGVGTNLNVAMPPMQVPPPSSMIFPGPVQSQTVTTHPLPMASINMSGSITDVGKFSGISSLDDFEKALGNK